MIDADFPNLLEEGELTFTEFDEGGIDWFTVKEPIKVQWQVWKDTEENDTRYAHIIFDFGMSYKISVETNRNFLLTKLNGIDENSSFEEKIKTIVMFDVMHALTHCDMDPNYTHFHWAIKGWLWDRLEKHERDPFENEKKTV